MGEAREGDCRVQLIIGLFFICVVGGGVSLCHFIFLKETEASNWYYQAGITLEAIPWAFWFLTYLYTCFKHRVKRKQTPPPKTAELTTAPPTSSPKSNEQLNSHFGLAVAVEDERQGMDGGGNEDQSSGDNSNRTTSLSKLNDVEFGIRESEMPLKFGSSSCG